MVPCVQRGDNRDKEQTDVKKKDRLEVYWCKSYQRGTCGEKMPHMLQIKADEPPVLVVHFCAYCLQKDNRRMEHPEAECPKKGGT